MSNEPTVASWGPMARVFHWATLALIIIQIPLGFWMVEVYEVYSETYADDTWVMRTSMLHHTLGLTLLAVAFARFGWRMSHPAPALPAGLATYQRWLARFTHIFLYVLLFVYPLSGWASLSAYEGEFPIFFLGWDSVPRIVPQVSEEAFLNYEFFAGIHRYCWRVGAVVLGMHIAGALWHQFVVKDNVLRRMWAGR
jgi:cytochrome b561